jgi:hypothetical protein
MKELKVPPGTPPFISCWPRSRGGKRIVFGKTGKVDFWRWYHPARRVTFITALIFAADLDHATSGRGGKAGRSCSDRPI